VQLKWLDSLKIAIINEDINQIDVHCSNIPHFKDINETIQAKALIDEALKVVMRFKERDKKEFEKLKKASTLLSNENQPSFSINS